MLRTVNNTGDSSVPLPGWSDKLFALDKNHSYYYQIWGQLFVTKRNVSILVVYTFNIQTVVDNSIHSL